MQAGTCEPCSAGDPELCGMGGRSGLLEALQRSQAICTIPMLAERSGEQGRRNCIHNSTRRKGSPRAGEKASLTHDARAFYSPEAFSSRRQN